MTQPAIFTCALCGRTAEDVHKGFGYVGGRGITELPPQCRDETECAFRWDEQNGLTNFSLKVKE